MIKYIKNIVLVIVFAILITPTLITLIAYIYKDTKGSQAPKTMILAYKQMSETIINKIYYVINSDKRFNYFTNKIRQSNKKNKKPTNNIYKELQKDKHIEADMDKEYSLLEYSIKYPYIKVNPYGRNPLSAIIRFNTQEPTKVQLYVQDRYKDKRLLIYEEKDYKTEHKLSAKYLYANHNNKLIIKAISKDKNKKSTKSKEYGVGVKIDKLKSKSQTRNDFAPIVPIKRESDITRIYRADNIFFDNDGRYRGMLQYNCRKTFKAFNQNFFLLCGKLLIETNILGKIINTYSFEGYKFHHDVIIKSDGNILALANKMTNGIWSIEDIVIEIDTNTKEIIREWDLENILDKDRIMNVNPIASKDSDKDWFHANSLYDIPQDNAFIISSRHQGVFKISYEGELIWIMSPHINWKDKFKPYLLTAISKDNKAYNKDIQQGIKIHKDFRWNLGQHQVTYIGDNQYLMFNNGYGDKQYKNKNYKQNNTPLHNFSYSSSSIYKIDEDKKQVMLVREYGGEDKKFAESKSGAFTYDNKVLSFYADIPNADVVIKSTKKPTTYGSSRLYDMHTQKIIEEILYHPDSLYLYRAAIMTEY